MAWTFEITNCDLKVGRYCVIAGDIHIGSRLGFVDTVRMNVGQRVARTIETVSSRFEAFQ
jgi:UDP-3-O-[3-hydroxymyristoyl] glucosamine N-acyltransferase